MRADRAEDVVGCASAIASSRSISLTRVEIVTMRADAGRTRAIDHRVAVLVKVGEVEMAVAVDEHRSG